MLGEIWSHGNDEALVLGTRVGVVWFLRYRTDEKPTFCYLFADDFYKTHSFTGLARDDELTELLKELING